MNPRETHCVGVPDDVNEGDCAGPALRGIQIPTVSNTGTNGSPVRNFTWSAYAFGPLVANAFEMKCSSRNAPTGMIPLNECRRRRRNEWPLPARIGGTPRSTGEAMLAMYCYAPIRLLGKLYIMKPEFGRVKL